MTYLELKMLNASETCTNSSGNRFWQQFDVIVKAFLCAEILKKSKKVKQVTTPLACKMALLCFFESISKAERLCSATSMHWMLCNFSKKVGMASTITELDLGRASII